MKPFVLRSPTRWYVVAIMVFCVALAIAVAIAGTTLSFAARLAVAGAGIVAVWAAYQVSKWSITCDESGVTAINEYGKKHLEWGVVERFEQRGLNGIGVTRSDTNSWVRLMFYATFGDVSEEQAAEILEQQRLIYQGKGRAEW